jgi:membrane-bound serine protease (ClpP class)
MDIGQSVFSAIASPDIAYALLVLGLFSLVTAFAAPGTGFAEIAAVLCLTLAFIGLAQLPVNWAGLLLIVVGVGLFILDLKLQTSAIALGGAAALGIGSLFLFQPTGEAMRVSVWLIGLVTLGSSAYFGFALNRVMRAMKLRPKVDAKAILGAAGVVNTPLLSSNQMVGTAQIDGELWTIHSDEPLAPGTPIVVERINGLMLEVRRAGRG